MRKLVLLAMLSFPAVAVSVAPETALQPSGRDCPRARVQHTDNIHGGATARRLDQLPAGRLELTVLRQIDRCPIPAVVREGIGGPPVSHEPRRHPR